MAKKRGLPGRPRVSPPCTWCIVLPCAGRMRCLCALAPRLLNHRLLFRFSAPAALYRSPATVAARFLSMEHEHEEQVQEPPGSPGAAVDVDVEDETFDVAAAMGFGAFGKPPPKPEPAAPAKGANAQAPGPSEVCATLPYLHKRLWTRSDGAGAGLM